MFPPASDGAGARLQKLPCSVFNAVLFGGDVTNRSSLPSTVNGSGKLTAADHRTRDASSIAVANLFVLVDRRDIAGQRVGRVRGVGCGGSQPLIPTALYIVAA